MSLNPFLQLDVQDILADLKLTVNTDPQGIL